MLSGLKTELQAANTNKQLYKRCVKHITQIQNKMLNHGISNRLKRPLPNSYLDSRTIWNLDLSRNDVVHNLDSIMRSVFLGPSTLPRFCKCYNSYCSYCTICHNQNIVQWKTKCCISFYFHRTTHWL